MLQSLWNRNQPCEQYLVCNGSWHEKPTRRITKSVLQWQLEWRVRKNCSDWLKQQKSTINFRGWLLILGYCYQGYRVSINEATRAFFNSSTSLILEVGGMSTTGLFFLFFFLSIGFFWAFRLGLEERWDVGDFIRPITSLSCPSWCEPCVLLSRLIRTDPHLTVISWISQ